MNTYMPPHKGSGTPVHHAGNAALLIDFDNVTMGIRSDLTKELKNLLNSDIIKGKVAVQRAYADWRRYPQYIVPLSEGSVDLIFAPAYGSSKKNATDIRLAIDALELVFTRPEIGTFILLSGDSDFSSLVLKLKEYGKYVIGVGIKESSSDLLVQNCDEYYSYNALTGLQRAGEEGPGSRMDPWDLVQAAVERMAENDDVMRSDRLKQVMIEMDDSFDEKVVGFSKYNRFLSEAASKGRIKLRKLENGQYEVAPAEGRRRASARPAGAGASSGSASMAGAPALAGASESGGAMTLAAAYDLLRRAVRDLAGAAGGAVRDSDVKRRMLELRSDWDETAVGFGKFSHFLRQAHNSEIIDLQRTGEGLYEVVLPSSTTPVAEEEEEDGDTGDATSARMSRGSRSAPAGRGGNGRGGRGGRDREEREPRSRGRGRGRGRDRERPAEELPPSEPKLSGEEATGSRPVAEGRASGESVKASPRTREERPAAASASSAASAPTRDTSPPAAPPAGLGRGRRGPRRGAAEGPPPLLPGQAIDLGGASRAVSAGSSPVTPTVAPQAASRADEDKSAERTPARAIALMPELGNVLDPKELGLPTEAGAVQRYLTNRYRGVGDKTAEQLVETFGAEHVFAALQAAPERVSELVGAHRASALLDAWRVDYGRRTGADAGQSAPDAETPVSRSRPEPSPATVERGGEPAEVEREIPAPATERESRAPGTERETIPADIEREPAAPDVERELPPGSGEGRMLSSDVERETPDLWSNPREPRGE